MSVAVGVGKLTGTVAAEPQSRIVRLVGQTMTGGVASRMTVTMKLQDRVLPQLSVAVQTTVLVPTGKELPEAGTQVNVTFGSRLSETVGGGKSTGMVAAVPQSKTTWLLGQVMEGGVVSRVTRTKNVQVVRLVQSSVAVQVTVVLPRGNRLPDGGEQVTATLKSALSVAVGVG